MSETVTLDEKGRLVLPKKIREQAGITANKTLVVRASGIGLVELSDPDLLASKAREIGSKKLKGWKEEDHEASSYLTRMMASKKRRSP